MSAHFITYTPHGVAESSALLGTTGGAHIMNLQPQEDLDNGSFVSLGDFVSGDVFKAAKPVATAPVLLVLSSTEIYDEYLPKMQEESNFFNGKDDGPVRAYVLGYGDRFALSKEAFADGQTPAVGKYLKIGTGYKAEVADAAVEGQKFVAKIYDVAANGNFRVIVLANA